MTDQLPADIAEAVRRVVETQRAFALMDHHPSNWQAAKASVECSDALSALDAVILKHLRSTDLGRSALAEEGGGR